MIRASGRIATAVRTPDQQVLVKSDPYVALAKRHKLLGIPVVRGAVAFFEMLYIGLKALNYSADVAMAQERKAGEHGDRPRTSGEKAKDALFLGGTLLFAFAVAIGLFFALPLFLAQLTGLSRNALGFNLLAGTIRVALLLAYLWGIGRWGEIRRVFAYHGAEHKTIFAYESGQELTVEQVRPHGTHHPRCGTSFLLVVVTLAILLFALADTIVQDRIGHRPTLLQRFVTHFSLLPLLGGVSFELLKLSGKKQSNRIVRWLTAPGLWLQRITTRQPDDAQLEVAIAAVKGALADQDPEPQPGLDEPQRLTQGG